jgi:hypothetical protein
MIAAPLSAVDLDLWLPDPTVRTYHRLEAAIDPASLWAAAESLRIGETGLLGRLVRWRVAGTRHEETYREMFTSEPFLVIDEGEHHLLAGLCGTIWTAQPALSPLASPSEFRDWSVPGTVQVLFAQWTAPTGRGAALVSEVRVAPVDRSARLRLRGLWPLIGRFEGLIGSQALRLAVCRSENAFDRRRESALS